MSPIVPLQDLDRDDLAGAGGKAANLGSLIRAGLPVPPGFCVTTPAYREFVSRTGVDAAITDALAVVDVDDPASLESASVAIGAAFTAHPLPPDLAEAVLTAYAAMSPFTDDATPDAATGQGSAGVPVAVRSSATAEDLPDLSFAGQQDTYLNIVGAEALLASVVCCWASLWTARAIGYRARNGIAHDDLALAVVVQQLVPSEVSGVMFTADPLTGTRTRTVVDAVHGLGEALVSGRVEPDHYVVDPATGAILERTLGAKAFVVRGVDGGGTEGVADTSGRAAAQQALPDEQIRELAQLGARAERFFGSPQDLEWCWAAGVLYIVQSRPITSLYPLPDDATRRPTTMLLSFGAWQGMLDPFTAVGQDAMRCLVAGVSSRYGRPTDLEGQQVLRIAGERLFVDIGPLLRTSAGRTAARTFLSAVDRVALAVVEHLADDPRFALRQRRRSTAIRMAGVIAPIALRVLALLAAPDLARVRLTASLDASIAEVRQRCTAATDLADLARVVERCLTEFGEHRLSTMPSAVAAGNAPHQILLRTLTDPRDQELLAEVTRGLPHNVTMEMDLRLWDTAQAVRADADSLACLRPEPGPADDDADTNADADKPRVDVARIAERYRDGDLPPALLRTLDDFLARYGARGVGEIDLGRPRWRQDPTGVLQVVDTYLDMPEAASPRAAHERGAVRAGEACAELVRRHRAGRGGPARALLVRLALNRVRKLAGLRETPKFTAVRVSAVIREALVAAGADLVDRGVLDSADDLLHLHFREIAALGSGQERDWRALVADRRERYRRELRRPTVPHVMLSDGTAFHTAPTSDGAPAADLTGSPVSAGSVTGRVRVVLDPVQAGLRPGEILVCPATDPAWTPLFLAAGGLVTEVGGMMTHGSVVAREYGIPAVVGVHDATRRLRTGDLVVVDGSAGTITVLEPPPT